MVKEMGVRFKREGALWLIHADIWQKTTKFCKTIDLQLKNNFKKSIHMSIGIFKLIMLSL